MASRRSKGGTVLVTGATGFVGGHLVPALRDAGINGLPLPRATLEQIVLSKCGVSALQGCHCLVHLAARAHVLNESSPTLLDVYRRANRDVTLKLAQAAVAACVSRFVFVSSIRVNGSATSRPFRADDPPSPQEPYAISKLEAELGLWQISRETGLEVVVIRPPLVYGRGVQANFRRLLALVASGVPLPLGSIEGRRSLIYVGNLCDLLRACIQHLEAPGHTFLASDGEDVSLPSLIRELAAGMGCPARLFPAPVGLLRAGAKLIGKGAAFEKLTGSLQVDPTETFHTLGWAPPISTQEGLRATAHWYAETFGARR